MCVLTSFVLFYPQKDSAQIKTSVEFKFSYLFYFYSVIMLIFSCSPVEKGNEMLNCWEGMETEVAFFECFVWIIWDIEFGNYVYYIVLECFSIIQLSCACRTSMTGMHD